MANKFSKELSEAKSLIEPTDKASAPNRHSTSSTVRKSEKDEISKGVVVSLPLRYYRRLRDYKDEHPGETLQSLSLKAIIEWIDENA